MKKNQNEEAELLASVVVADGVSIAVAGTKLGWSAAKSYGVSRSPAYRAAKLDRLSELADATFTAAIDAGTEAVQVLRALMASDDPAIAVQAAKGILAHRDRQTTALERLTATTRDQDRRDRASADDDLHFFSQFAGTRYGGRTGTGTTDDATATTEADQ